MQQRVHLFLLATELIDLGASFLRNLSFGVFGENRVVKLLGDALSFLLELQTFAIEAIDLFLNLVLLALENCVLFDRLVMAIEQPSHIDDGHFGGLCQAN